MGDEARWKTLYGLILKRAIGEEITYREVEELLLVDRDGALAAMRQARVHLESDGERSVRTVTNFGWIVMSPRQEVDEIENRRRRAGNRVKDGLRIAASVGNRRDELSPFEREELDRTQRSMRMLADLFGRRRKPLGELHGQGEITP